MVLCQGGQGGTISGGRRNRGREKQTFDNKQNVYILQKSRVGKLIFALLWAPKWLHEALL